MPDPIRQTHHRACHLCEAICGVIIETEGDRITGIRGDTNDPLSRGHICPKAIALQDLHEDPDRLRQPMRRVRSQIGEYHHEACSWEEALDAAASGLMDVIEQHGVDSLGVYFGNPSVHNYGMMTHQNALFRHLRTRNRFSATSVDQLPHHLIALWFYGHKLMFPIPDIDRTDFMIMLGANPVASNGSIWTVPDVRRRIKDLLARGGELIVIDPRRTETAAVASEHHFIRPGGDAALLLAMIHVLFRDNLVALGRLGDFVDGIDQVAQWVSERTPVWAESISQIPEDAIVSLAHRLAYAPRSIVYGRMGVSTQRFGTLCQWAIQVLNILTGQLDQEGGSLFTRPAVDQILSAGPGGFARHHSRVRGLPEFDRELPVATLAEEIDTPGEGQIRALFTGAGNPVLSTPAGHALDAALESLEFMVSLDPYLNETTRHADVILPPTSPLEHDHYDLIFHHAAVRNTTRFSEAVFPKPADAMHDWEIFVELGARVAERLGQPAQPATPPADLIDLGLQMGPYGQSSEHKLSLAALRDAPSGIDLGPLMPQLPERLQTANQRIDVAVAEIAEDIHRLAASSDQDATYRLIGRRHVRDNNSWMHNHHRLVKGPDRSALWVNDSDAGREGWQAGDRLELRSAAGAVIVTIAITSDVMPGVVSLPHGYGHGRQGTQMTRANTLLGASCNDVTDAYFLDDLSGNAALNGVPVTLLRYNTGQSSP
jgi:anaerobic selenocysteine-containing dehydrogenase